MPRYAQGAPVRVSTVVTDATGALTNPGTILLRVRKPDGTLIPDYTSPTQDATGKYHVDIPATDLPALGHYGYAWITTGNAAGVSPPASFELVDPFVPTHITYADALERLDLTTATLTQSRQAELQAMISSALDEQEKRVGAVAPRTVTRVFVPSRCGLILRDAASTDVPILSVTSATLNGASVDITGWAPLGDGTAGIIRTSSTYSATWLSSYPSYTGYAVTYVAGRSPVPQALVEAGLLRVAHSYATQRGGSGNSRLAGSGFDDSTGPDSDDFLLQLRAEAKEQPYLIPAIA